MKNYDETINSVFDRISEYEIEKKRKRKIVTRTVTSLSCFCLAALIGIGVWQSDMFKPVPPAVLDGSSSIGGFDDSSLQATDNNNLKEPNQSQQSVTVPNENGNSNLTTSNNISNDNDVKSLCFLNHIEGIAGAAPLYLDPTKHYTKDWDDKQVADYFGLDFSDLYSAYKYVGNAQYTVTYDNSGSLARDLVGCNYMYNDTTFTVMASKLGKPYDCIYTLDEEKTTSLKSNDGSVDVLFATKVGNNEKMPGIQDLMVADFEHNGVYYRVIAEKISVKDFYGIVSCILNK